MSPRVSLSHLTPIPLLPRCTPFPSFNFFLPPPFSPSAFHLRLAAPLPPASVASSGLNFGGIDNLFCVLEFLPEIFETLRNEWYALTELEVAIFLPCVMEKVSQQFKNLQVVVSRQLKGMVISVKLPLIH